MEQFATFSQAMSGDVQESKHACSGHGKTKSHVIDVDNSEDHRNNVDHNASLEKFCHLDAAGAKTHLPSVVSSQATRKERSTRRNSLRSSWLRSGSRVQKCTTRTRARRRRSTKPVSPVSPDEKWSRYEILLLLVSPKLDSATTMNFTRSECPCPAMPAHTDSRAELLGKDTRQQSVDIEFLEEWCDTKPTGLHHEIPVQEWVTLDKEVCKTISLSFTPKCSSELNWSTTGMCRRWRAEKAGCNGW